MPKYLIDTNIRAQATISVITECEVLASPVLTPQDERQVLRLLAVLPSVAVTSHVARLGAQLRRQYRLTIADALIAATALRSHATLLTRDVKDFRAVKGLHLHSL